MELKSVNLKLGDTPKGLGQGALGGQRALWLLCGEWLDRGAYRLDQ